MTSLSGALRIATNGVNTSQIGLGTIAHNIANNGTEGYHRQGTQFSSVSHNGFGDGVELQTIQRTVDKFLSKRLTDQISTNSYNSSYLSHMEDIQTVLGDPTGDSGIDKLFNKFFTDLSSLSNYPNSSSQKRNVVQQATLLADTLRNTNADLDTAQERIDDKVDDAVTAINGILKNIYDLNKDIVAISTNNTTGSNANDLKDKRQNEIDKLAEYVGIQVNTTSSGASRILTENGRQLIDVATYTQVERISGTPFQGIGIRKILVDGSSASNYVELNMSTVTKGSLKALTSIRDTKIPNMLAELDKLTTTFKTQFNKIHSRGSSFPPVNSLSSGNTSGLAATTTDMYANLDASLDSDTFDISVVDSQGDVVATTLVTGNTITGTGPITLPAGGTFSLDDLATLINANTDISNATLGGTNGVTATAGLDSSGNPQITIAANDSNLRVVLANASGDVLGILGMNNFFTGTDSNDINVKSTIKASPALIATGRMRSDGGLSSLDNSNLIQLAELSEDDQTFASAGDLPALTTSFTGYTVQILSNFAVDIQDSQDKSDFSDSLLFDLKGQNASTIGVNLDEELAQMLVFQNSFQASARIISTVDNLLQFLIQTVG